MKKIYESPVFILVAFDNSDVITSSITYEIEDETNDFENGIEWWG